MIAWLYENKLVLNFDKKVLITFTNNKTTLSCNVKLQIASHILKSVENTKYLGLIFDRHVKWNGHIRNLTNRTKYLLFMFAKLKIY